MTSSVSVAGRLAQLSPEERQEILAGFSEDELEALQEQWEFWARPEQIPPDWSWFIWLLLTGRAFGKPVAIDTPIPTPEGWKLAGEIQAGDFVLDHAGNPTRVTEIYDPGITERWRVTFDDGTFIDAGPHHEWCVLHREDAHAPRYDPDWWRRGRVVTTIELMLNLDEIPVTNVNAEGAQTTRVVKSVERVADGPLVCLAVETESHLFLAGRGMIPTHNTRTGAEFIHQRMNSGKYGRTHLVARTAADFRDTMVEGESGLLATAKKSNPVKYIATKRKLEWENGAVALCFSAEEPDQLRGPQCDCLVADTQVLLADGSSCAIDALTPGVLVATRVGPRAVTNAALVHRAANVFKVRTSDGHELIGTARHKIATPSGWVQIEDLGVGDKILTWATIQGSRPSQQSSTTEMSGTPATVCTSQAKAAGCTTTSGASTTSKRSLEDGLFITSIATPPIMRSRIFNFSLAVPTRRSTVAPDAAGSLHGLRSKLVRRLVRRGQDGSRNGPTADNAVRQSCDAPRWKSSSATRDADDVTAEKMNVSRLLAHFVARYLAGLSRLPQRSTALVSAQLLRESIVVSHELAGTAPVYDITVEDAHEFIANGIVVHNSAWGDEPASWQMVVGPDGLTAFDNLLFGLRLGDDPRLVLTTTPKRVPLVKQLLAREGDDVHITRGTLFDNAANLPFQYVKEMTARYAGLRQGAQELRGILLGDVEGALWSEGIIDLHRRSTVPDPDELERVVIGVDPPGTTAEAGIIPVARSSMLLPTSTGRMAKHVYILNDWSMAGPPEAWGKRAVDCYYHFKADRIIAERNNGGDMVRAVIHNADPTVPVELVWASRGKYTRAEPIAQLSGQAQLHVIGYLGELEGQMTNWVPGEKSPDRLDAMVWGITEFLPGLSLPEPKLHTGVGRHVRTGASTALSARSTRDSFQDARRHLSTRDRA